MTALLGALIVFYLCFILGRRLVKIFGHSFATNVGRIGYAFIFGYGALAFAGFILVILHIFYAALMWLVIAVTLLALRIDIYADFKIAANIFNLKVSGRRILTFIKSFWFLKILIILWIGGNLLLAFVPLTGHDTLDYHFPIIQSLINYRGIEYSLNIPSFEYLPVLGEIFYAFPTAIFYEQSAPYVFQILQYLVILPFTLIVFNFVHSRVKNKLFAFAAILAVLSLMDFQRELLHGGYVDVVGFLFGIGATLLLIDHLDRNDWSYRNFIACGVLLGLALSVKYTGLFFLFINLLFILIKSIAKRMIFSGFLKSALLVLAPSIIISSFWYIRNLLVFGNPFYPIWSDPQATSDVGLFIMDRTILNFFYFPFYRYGQWFIQEVESSSRLVVLGLFILMYLLMLLALLFKKRISFTSVFVFLFVFVEIYLAFLFISSHQYRFIIPATIVLAALVALLADNFFDAVLSKISSPSRLQFFQKALVTVTFLGFFVLYLGNLHYFAVKWDYVLGKYSESEYIIKIGGQ